MKAQCIALIFNQLLIPCIASMLVPTKTISQVAFGTLLILGPSWLVFGTQIILPPKCTFLLIGQSLVK